MTNEDAAAVGRAAWTAVGIAVLLVIAWIVLRTLAVVVVPLVLALFPATLLVPVARRLERWRMPSAVAALLTLAGGLTLFLGVAAGTVTLVVEQAPDVVGSAGEGVDRLEELIGRVVPGFEIPAVDELRDMVVSGAPNGSESSDSSGGASQALSVAMDAVEVVSGIVLLVVVLFFYLKDGRRLAEGFAAFVAPDSRARIMELADEGWDTVGAYFRGQLLVALSDAVLIGIGLVILDVPLALPLSAMVFFGGLFPIIGALVTGALAVLVGFSDGGLGIGLAVLGVVVVVQQLEGNVLEPLILGHAIDLDPLSIVVSITMGAILLGVLGAFLAVPAVAAAKRMVVRLRDGGDLGRDEAGAPAG